jgi:hypothetical protein
MQMEKITCPYLLNGYESRRDYLEQLAEGYGVSQSVVFALANMLGEVEDFDGLVHSVHEVSEDMMLNEADNEYN